MNRNEKIKHLTATTPSTWKEEATKRAANRGARRNARKVALLVLEALATQKLTQTELAERMSVSRQQVSKIVKGEENFTFETIDKLERALDISILQIAEPAPAKAP